MYFAFTSTPINTCNLSQHFHIKKCENVVTKCVIHALQLHRQEYWEAIWVQKSNWLKDKLTYDQPITTKQFQVMLTRFQTNW